MYCQAHDQKIFLYQLSKFYSDPKYQYLPTTQVEKFYLVNQHEEGSFGALLWKFGMLRGGLPGLPGATGRIFGLDFSL